MVIILSIVINREQRQGEMRKRCKNILTLLVWHYVIINPTLCNAWKNNLCSYFHSTQWNSLGVLQEAGHCIWTHLLRMEHFISFVDLRDSRCKTFPFFVLPSAIYLVLGRDPEDINLNTEEYIHKIMEQRPTNIFPEQSSSCMTDYMVQNCYNEVDNQSGKK